MDNEPTGAMVGRLRGHSLALIAYERYPELLPSGMTNRDAVSYGRLLAAAADLLERLSPSQGGREEFLHQLRRVNTERYMAWAGEEPLMLCADCGASIDGSNSHCVPPFKVQLHSFTKEHPYLKSSGDAGILFDAAELGGEVGELLNVVKKLEREERGWRGSRAAPEDFADECADVLICLDKLARRRDVDLVAATIAKFNATSDKVGLPQKLAALSGQAGEGA